MMPNAITENEARKKWCPHAISANPRESGHASVNRKMKLGDNADVDCMCLASHCMCWRWVGGRKEHGFCGLAGDCGYKLTSGRK